MVGPCSVGGRAGRRIRDPVSAYRTSCSRVAGERQWFLDTMTDPAFHLLLCGPVAAWDEQALASMEGAYGDLLRTHRITHVSTGIAAHWGVRDTAHLLIRPDGHVAYRREDGDLSGAAALLARWLSPTTNHHPERVDGTSARCGCCGRTHDRSRLTELGDTPGVFICARCAVWAARRSGGLTVPERVRSLWQRLHTRRPARV